MSVIILNYNGESFLRENVESVVAQSYSNIEIIVLDNASNDNSLNILKQYSQSITLIQNPTNLGFSANNIGMKHARGEYFLILNNDTVLEETMIEEAMRVLQDYPDAGMLVPKILQYQSPQIIDSVGLAIYRDGMSRQRGRFEEDVGQYDQVEEVFAPSGCAGFYKRQMIEQVGGIDEDFFAYCEDTDLGFRCRLVGWKAYSAPRSRVYHHFSGSWKKSYAMKAFLVERNHVWVALKCFPLSNLVVAPVYTFWRYCVQTYAILMDQGIGGQFVRREKGGAWQLFLILIWANVSALLGLPKALRKRYSIQTQRQVTVRDVKSWFREYNLPLRTLVLKH